VRKRADLVVLSKELEVQRVYRDGHLVSARDGSPA
jgi:hypothetical protein